MTERKVKTATIAGRLVKQYRQALGLSTYEAACLPGWQRHASTWTKVENAGTASDNLKLLAVLSRAEQWPKTMAAAKAEHRKALKASAANKALEAQAKAQQAGQLPLEEPAKAAEEAKTSGGNGLDHRLVETVTREVIHQLHAQLRAQGRQ